MLRNSLKNRVDATLVVYIECSCYCLSVLFLYVIPISCGFSNHNCPYLYQIMINSKFVQWGTIRFFTHLA